MVMVMLPMGVGMRVTAMAVMMVVAVIVMMCLILVVIMATVTVRISMRMAMARIGAAHRIEGCHDLLDFGAEPEEHRFDDMIAQDQDTVRRDSRSQMAVADMPGEFGQMERTAPADNVERFVGRRNFDRAAALNGERVAGCQHDRYWEVDQDLTAVARFDHATPQMPLVMLEHGAAEYRFERLGEICCPPDGYRFQHAALRFGQSRLVHTGVSPADRPVPALTIKEVRGLARLVIYLERLTVTELVDLVAGDEARSEA
jgi:hypothetical protein